MIGISKFLKSNHFYFLAWVILTSSSFAVFNLPFIWISYVPLIIIIHKLPISKLIKYGFWYSILYYLGTLFWLIAFHEASTIFVFPLLSLYTTMAMILTRYASVIFPKYKIFMFPLFWIGFEIFRSVGFLGFRWNTPADALWQQLVFLQSADTIGAWGVGFLVLLVNSALAEIISNKIDGHTWRNALLKNYLPIYIILFLFLCNLAYGLSAYSHWTNIVDNKLKTQKVALLQPNRPGHSSWLTNEEELTTKYIDMVNSITNQNPDLILQTEIMLSTYFWENLKVFGEGHGYNRFQKKFLDQAKENGIPTMITHFGADAQRRSYNSATLIHYTNNTLKTNTFNKIHIVPFGEWIPGSQNWKWLDNLLTSLGAAWASPGEDFTIFTALDNIKFAMLICFEDIFAILGRRYVDKGAQYFVNSTNDGWAYRWKIGSVVPLWQHLANTTHTAISLRRSIARSVNTGISGVVDPVGRMDLSPIKAFKDGIHVANVPVMPSEYRSIYVINGWVIQYVLFFLMISTAFITLLYDPKSQKLKKIL